MDKKITIKLYSQFHEGTLRVEGLTWNKDTLNVVQFAVSSYWDVKGHTPTFWSDGTELTDYTTKNLYELGICDGDWLSVGWRSNEEAPHMILCS